jgi:signal transduction histidine kinase
MLIIRAVISAVIWGSASWILLPASTIQGETFVVMGISMILMGGAGGHAAHRPTLFAFATPIAVIFSAGLIRFGDLIHVTLGIGFLVSALVTVFFAMNQGEAVRKQVTAALESDSLRVIADSAARAKTDFLAAASHDLRQPLHALTMFLGTMTFHVATPDAKRLLGRIQETVHVLEEQFNSLLDLSRFDAGAVVAEMKPFRLDYNIERLIDELRPMAASKHLELTASVCPAVAKSDPLLLGRLLRNLLDNAVKYTVSGSVNVRVTGQSKAFLVEVSDTGLGIPADQQKRIFNEYVQLANPGRQRRHGVGLGLAIVKRIDSLLGLNLHMQSTEGVGTRFSFVVPASVEDADVNVRPTLANAAELRISASVWVLDDDPIALEGMQEQLAAWGAQVRSFSRPEDLLAELRAGTPLPHWICTDDMLGASLSGLETAQILSGQFGFGKVCLITGNTEPARLAELRSSGFPVIVKPAKVEHLFAILEGT